MSAYARIWPWSWRNPNKLHAKTESDLRERRMVDDVDFRNAIMTVIQTHHLWSPERKDALMYPAHLNEIHMYGINVEEATIQMRMINMTHLCDELQGLCYPKSSRPRRSRFTTKNQTPLITFVITSKRWHSMLTMKPSCVEYFQTVWDH